MLLALARCIVGYCTLPCFAGSHKLLCWLLYAAVAVSAAVGLQWGAGLGELTGTRDGTRSGDRKWRGRVINMAEQLQRIGATVILHQEVSLNPIVLSVLTLAVSHCLCLTVSLSLCLSLTVPITRCVSLCLSHRVSLTVSLTAPALTAPPSH